MAGALDFLFGGTVPPTATSTAVTQTGMPDWWQEYLRATVNQAAGVAATPYQAFPGPLVAERTPLQEQAATMVQQNVGAYTPAVQGGLSVLGNIATGTGPASVTDAIARLGTRNLTENLLPKVQSEFIGAGQFGSGRHGEFAARAVRDVNESILNAQAQALLQDQQQRMSAAQQMGALGTLGQQMGLRDVAALDVAGLAQQQQAQANIEALKGQFQEERGWPAQQTVFLSDILRGINPPTTQTATTTAPFAGQMGPSGLATLAGGALTAGAIQNLFKARGGAVGYAGGGSVKKKVMSLYSQLADALSKGYRLDVQGAADGLRQSYLGNKLIHPDVLWEEHGVKSVSEINPKLFFSAYHKEHPMDYPAIYAEHAVPDDMYIDHLRVLAKDAPAGLKEELQRIANEADAAGYARETGDKLLDDTLGQIGTPARDAYENMDLTFEEALARRRSNARGGLVGYAGGGSVKKQLASLYSQLADALSRGYRLNVKGGAEGMEQAYLGNKLMHPDRLWEEHGVKNVSEINPVLLFSAHHKKLPAIYAEHAVPDDMYLDHLRVLAKDAPAGLKEELQRIANEADAAGHAREAKDKRLDDALGQIGTPARDAYENMDLTFEEALARRRSNARGGLVR